MPGASSSKQFTQTWRKAPESAAIAAAGSYLCLQLLWCRYQYTVTSWIWIRPSHDGSSPMTEPYQSARLSKRAVIEQLTDASLGSQNPAWFTTHSPTESLTRFYSPPQTHSKGRIRLCPQHSQPQFIYNAICQGDVSDKRGVAIRRKLCPWWRRTDVIKAVSCCRARKLTPTTWNYLNHASASRKRGLEFREKRQGVQKAKWGITLSGATSKKKGQITVNKLAN